MQCNWNINSASICQVRFIKNTNVTLACVLLPETPGIAPHPPFTSSPIPSFLVWLNNCCPVMSSLNHNFQPLHWPYYTHHPKDHSPLHPRQIFFFTFFAVYPWLNMNYLLRSLKKLQIWQNERFDLS